VDVAEYLRKRGVAFKPADARNVHAACWYCDEDPSSRGRLYINIDPNAEVQGLFMCHRCGAKGSLASLKKHFGDSTNEYELDSQIRVEIHNVAAQYYVSQLGYFAEVVTYLKGPERGLHVETLKAHQIGYAPMEITHDLATDTTTTTWPKRLYSHLRSEGYETKDILATGLCHERDNTIVDALGGMVTIPYVTAGNVVAIRGRTWPFDEDDFTRWMGDPYTPAKAKYKTCSGTGTRLYGTDACWGATEVFITEGEFDALVLRQQGYPAMGVPGAAAWQESWDDYLTPLKRVWLVYDRDAAGEKGANKLAERIGTKIRRVHLSEEGSKCDPTTFFAEHDAADFRKLLDEASKGGMLVTVTEAVEEFVVIQAMPGIKFGWELLDVMITPGLQAGQIMMLLAKTGTGKSLLLFNLLHLIRMVPEQENMKILLLSLEQTRGEWWDRARRIHRFYNMNSDEREAQRWWEGNILLVDQNRVSEAQLRQVLDDFEYQMGSLPDIVAIDYLGYWARSFRGEAYERTSAAAMALKSITKDYRIPMIVPHQVSRVGRVGEEFGADAARDSGVVEETADFLLTMWNPDNIVGRDEEEKSGQVHLRIAKSRHGGDGQLLTMQRAPISLAMVPAGDPLCAAARLEMDWKQTYRSTWAEAVFRHRTGVEGKLDPDAFTDDRGRS
jgi:hypothetical protein